MMNKPKDAQMGLSVANQANIMPDSYLFMNQVDARSMVDGFVRF